MTMHMPHMPHMPTHMNHSPVFKSTAVIEVLFGLALLLAPNQLMALYNAEALDTSVAMYNTMLYGGTLIGLSVMHWMASRSPEASVRSIVMGTLVTLVLCLVVALYKQLTDSAVPMMAWVNVAIFALLGAAFAGLALQHAPETAQAPSHSAT